MLKSNSWIGVIINALVILAIFFVMLLVFFKVYLPWETNHGETVTVPNLQGLAIEDVPQELDRRNLRYEVNTDSSYSDKFEPTAVISQHPKAGSKVKENRKIYLTLNLAKPPSVSIPDVVDKSFKDARNRIKGHGLKLGDINYVPYQFDNLVLKMYHNGREVKPGTSVPKGSQIDLMVGQKGSSEIEVPNLVGLHVEDAELAVIGNELEIGEVVKVPDANKEDGSVVKQYPTAGSTLRTGRSIDLWVVENAGGDGVNNLPNNEQ